MFLPRLTLLATLSLYLFLAYAARNVTIDDTYGDEHTGALPVYGVDTSTWHTSHGSCSGCKYTPQSASRIWNQTWHEGHVHSSQGRYPGWVNVTFSGVAVYAYFVRVVSGGDITHLLFELDGKFEGEYHFSGAQNLTQVFAFNECLFSKTNLSNSQHTLSIIVDDYGRRDNTGNVVLFDRVVYTQLDPGEASDSSISTPASESSATKGHGAVIGGAVGGSLAAILLIGVFILLYRHYRRDRQTIRLLRSKVQVLESSLRSARAESQAFELPPYSPTGRPSHASKSSISKDPIDV